VAFCDSVTVPSETKFRLIAILKELHVQLCDHDNDLAHIVIRGQLNFHLLIDTMMDGEVYNILRHNIVMKNSNCNDKSST
jgi:hypothetical protein